MVNPTGDYSVPGFPGQSQTTTDLYYNKYRDYDPTTGRYIQADPIGLAGGASPYSYAMNNPLRYTDPSGLTSLIYDAGLHVLRVDPERKGWAPYMLPASSGRPGCGCSEMDKDKGPIPLGGYEIQTNEISGGFFKNTYRYVIKRQDWGNWRVSLHPRPGTDTHGRSGFFLHGGSWPGSAGCIDVGGGFWGSPTTNRLRFDLQNDPDGRVLVSVIKTVVP
jgi:RHS repeat-associated protein